MSQPFIVGSTVCLRGSLHGASGRVLRFENDAVVVLWPCLGLLATSRATRRQV
jgi:hypothetical protein